MHYILEDLAKDVAKSAIEALSTSPPPPPPQLRRTNLAASPQRNPAAQIQTIHKDSVLPIDGPKHLAD